MDKLDSRNGVLPRCDALQGKRMTQRLKKLYKNKLYKNNRVKEVIVLWRRYG